MEKTIDDAKNLMELGWKAREKLEFEKAEELLTEAKNIFTMKSDWYNVTECLNHLAYTHKLKSAQELGKGMLLIEEATSISKEQTTKEQAILRAKMSLLSAKGNYENALKTAEKLATLTTKPINKADVLQHIATFQLRTGRISEALKSVQEAELLLEQGWEAESEPHRSIWKVSVLLVKGLILYNLGNITEATQIGNVALQIAKAKDLKTRINQVNEFLEMLNQ
jgi:tetratricopeptide (TPR) repeat protein